MRKSNLIFLVLGIGLLAYLVHEIGPARLYEQLGEVNGLFFAGVGAMLFSKVLMAIAWRYLLDDERSKATLWDLSLVTAVGGAINDVTPGGVGGEPLKVTWLQDKVPGEDLVSSLILHNYLYVLTNVILVVTGGILLVTLVELPAWAKWAVTGGMVVVIGAVVVLAMVIRCGVAERFLRLLDRLHIRFRNASTLLEKAKKTDAQARNFYREKPRALLVAFFWMVASRAVAAMESFFILAMLGHFVSPAAVLLVTCMTVAVYVAFAFVPSQLGALEGGAYLFFPVIGLAAPLGVAVEMVRRLRVLTLLVFAVAALGCRSVSRWWKSRANLDPTSPEPGEAQPAGLLPADGSANVVGGVAGARAAAGSGASGNARATG